MSISDIIERMLLDMMSDSDGIVEIRRNTMASELNCVPSQINYVIQTRFTPERGYCVESKRGGGGSVKIKQVKFCRENALMHFLNNIGASISASTAVVFVNNCVDYALITPREAKIILAATSDHALPFPAKTQCALRAVLLKNMLLSIAE